MSKLCVICEKELVGRQKKTCSVECRRKWKKEQQKKWRQNNPECDKEYYQNHSEMIKERGKKYRQNHKEEIKEYQKEYYQKHMEKIKEQQKKWRQNNPEKIKEHQKKWRQNNPEYDKEWRQNNPEYDKEWRQNNPECDKESGRKYRQNNPEKIKERNRKYRQNNPEKRKGYYRRSRGLPEDWDLTKTSTLEYIMERWSKEMGLEFETQHFISLKPFGGTHTWVDIYYPEVRVCFYCDGWYEHYVRLDKNGKTAHETRDADQNRILPMLGYKVIRLTGLEILSGMRPIGILEMSQ